MAKITLHSDNPVSATSVSNIFIDEYMSDANGEFVKIYLYLLRLMNAPEASFSISSIADKFEHTEKDIKRALSYWERMHLLRLEYDANKNLTGVCLLDSVSKNSNESAFTEEAPASKTLPVQLKPAVSAPASESGTTAVPAASVSAAPAKKSYSADDILHFRENESFAELLFIAERYLGRTLTATDINTISYLYDAEGLGFSAELIEYLIESCVSNNHTSIRYIEKVALGWHERHITTVDEAKQGSPVLGKAYYTVQNSFGITGRNLVPSEVAYINKWTGEYGFSDDIIVEACERTMSNLHKPNFKYADSILTEWHKAQVHHRSDIDRLDAAHQKQKKVNASGAATSGNAGKNKFNNFTQRSYDYDQLEQMLLTTNVH